MGVNLKDSVAFDISIEGDRTGEKWFGQFKSYKRLSHRQELMRDRITRELLGSNPAGASERAVSQAEMFAELQVSLVEAPTWWKEAGNGLDLGDDNIVREVWAKVMEIKVAAIEEITKKGDAAAQKLKDLAESNKVAQSE
jgi:hypothetical protein